MSIDLEEYVKDPAVAKRFEYNLNIKPQVRHPIVNKFDEFDDKSKEYLLELKKEVFKNNDIFIYGSRVNGTYIDDEEYEKYSKEYKNVKKSDWDIRCNFKPNIKEYKGYKLDVEIGNKGILVP